MTQMLLNALLLALRAIRRNLMRSFLTVLGVVIGVEQLVRRVVAGLQRLHLQPCVAQPHRQHMRPAAPIPT